MSIQETLSKLAQTQESDVAKEPTEETSPNESAKTPDEEIQEEPSEETEKDSVEKDSVEELRATLRKEIESDLRKQFSKLGRKEQMLKQKEAEVEKYSKYDGVDELVNKGNHYEAMKKLGVDYDKVTQQIVQGELPTPTATPELSPELKEAVEYMKTQKQTESQRQVEEQLNQAKQFLKGKATEANAEFILMAPDGIDVLYNFANNKFQTEGDVDIDDVIPEVEKFYKEQFDKALNTKYVQNKFNSKYQEYVKAKKKERATPSTSGGTAATSKPQKKLIPDELLGTAEGMRAALTALKQEE